MFNLEKKSQGQGGQRVRFLCVVLGGVTKGTPSSDQRLVKNRWADMGALSQGDDHSLMRRMGVPGTPLRPHQPSGSVILERSIGF